MSTAKTKDKRISVLQRFKFLMFYCGLTLGQFQLVRSTALKKNEKALYVAALSTIALGTVLFFSNIASASMAIYPCLFMMASGTIIGSTYFIKNKKQEFVEVLCYCMIICLLLASAVTSFIPSNRAYPATTFVAFLALIPLLFEQAPFKMAVFEIGAGTVYIAFARIFKEPAAFRLDVTNTITFVVIGIILYTATMRRYASDIWQTMRGKMLQNNVVTAVGTIIEARDGITGEHVFHTQKIVCLITEKMKKEEKYKELSDEYLESVCRASALHDIGKIKIPDTILNKPEKLTPEEFEVMKKHTEYGAAIVKNFANDESDHTFFEVTYNIVKYHHERWDGTGYPDGLKTEDIPLEARIMAVADVYDALISERPYKRAMTRDEAIDIIKNEDGSHFDPDVVRIFLIVV